MIINDKKNYLQRYIIYKVLSREYKPFQKIMSEASFAIKFSMSRAAVRTALKELKYAGLLSSQKGKGYFITDEFNTLLNEGVFGDTRKEVDYLDNPSTFLDEIKGMFVSKKILAQINIRNPFAYKKLSLDDEGLQNVKLSIINSSLTKDIEFDNLKKETFLTLASFHGVKISWIKKIVVFGSLDFLDVEARQLGYKDEYPIVLTSSFVGDVLLDVSVNIFRKKDFKFSINQEMFL